MRTIAALFATVTLASCSDGVPTAIRVTTAPTPMLGALISPQPLPIISAASLKCPFAPSFSTAFDLIVTTGSTRATLDQVTFRLLDGSSVGGPSVAFPQPELARMFGSTITFDRRAFTFRPFFDCVHTSPRSIAADVVLGIDVGQFRTMTAVAGFP